MPEMQVQADPRSSRHQFSKWMDALEHEGFYFMLLSDVVGQLNQGKTLPEKTAVIVFDPGYRRTADIYLPILEKKKIPAVWLTEGKALELHDSRYISAHLAQTMEASGLWDIGLYTAESPVTLRTHGHETVLLGHPSLWNENAGRFALNRGLTADPFERLDVNAKWTEQDLIHRLLVERPIHGSTILSLQQIQGRDWGIGLDPAAARETRFTLRAPSGKRSGSLYWLGTVGANDAHLRVEVTSLIGEMRILMRSDPSTGNGVSIVFGRGKVAVDQEINFQTQRLADVPCPDIMPNTPFNATLAVMGRQLALAVNNHPLVALETLSEPTSHQGMIRLAVQDSLKGVGEARSVRMIFTPLGKEK
jgi:Polysaccharide deacetylase